MRILMGMVFYPRGGSAQVVRYLSYALRERGHDVHLVVGTLDDGNPEHAAGPFYGDLPLTEVDYTEAFRGFQAGRDPITPEWATPFHPSYEDKPDVPDRVFWRVDEPTLRQLVDCWGRALESARGFDADVLHLHHLNQLHFAAEAWQVPKVGHLHGTELKMLEKMDAMAAPPDPAAHELWRKELSRTAGTMDHYFAISPDVRERGERLLGIDPARITTIPNGVDTNLFKPYGYSTDDKLALLRRLLVDEPKGWAEGGEPGSIAYAPEDLGRFCDAEGRFKPLVIFVGRFLGFKRVPLLMEAARKVNNHVGRSGGELPYNLLVWGGMPGEFEDEHPHTVAQRLGLDNVFFCGWLPHSILAPGLSLADVFVAPSYYEPFGQVFLESMAVGMPSIATRSGGPLSFVVDEGDDANGWFAEVDDADSLADVLLRAVTDVAERERRGRNARDMVIHEYSWTAISRHFEAVYTMVSE